MIPYNPIICADLILYEGENMDDIRGIIIDPDTGEQVGYLCDGDKVLRKASIEYLDNMQEWKIEHFFKGHIGEINKWLNELSIHEKAFLFSIVPYISYEDCHLQYSNGKDIGTEDLIKITKMARRTIFEVINSLVAKDILYKGKNSKNRQYFINPWLFCKGNRINKVLKTMFKNYRIRVLNNIKWGDLK
jgi:hypothetical protein